jgi:hypothetical protein
MPYTVHFKKMIKKDIQTAAARQQFSRILKEVRDYNATYTIRNRRGFAIAVICQPVESQLSKIESSRITLRKITRQLFDILGQYLDGPPYIIKEELPIEYEWKDLE